MLEFIVVIAWFLIVWRLSSLRDLWDSWYNDYANYPIFSRVDVAKQARANRVWLKKFIGAQDRFVAELEKQRKLLGEDFLDSKEIPEPLKKLVVLKCQAQKKRESEHNLYRLLIEANAKVKNGASFDSAHRYFEKERNSGDPYWNKKLWEETDRWLKEIYKTSFEELGISRFPN